MPVSVTPGSYPSGLIGEREQLARFPFLHCRDFAVAAAASGYACLPGVPG